MFNYYLKSFQNMFDFSGEASRAEYWWAYLCHSIVASVLFFIMYANVYVGLIVIIVYGLAGGVAMLACGVRRMHDAGCSGWVILIPFVSLFYLIKESQGGSDMGYAERNTRGNGGNFGVASGGSAGNRYGYTLVGLGGYFSGRSISIQKNVVIFGRDNTRCNAVYPNNAKGISRIHCQVEMSGGRLLLTDLGSAYGTCLQSGQLITPHQPWELRPGDRFYLASQENMFQVR